MKGETLNKNQMCGKMCEKMFKADNMANMKCCELKKWNFPTEPWDEFALQ